MVVYVIRDERCSLDHPLGDAIEVLIRREDAERFLDEVRRMTPSSPGTSASSSALESCRMTLCRFRNLLWKGPPWTRTPLQMGNSGPSVFDLTNEGMQEAAAELGDTTEFNGSTEADAQQQVEVINSAVAQNPDALLISANDPDALVPALESAESDGIQTVTLDSDVNPAARVIFASTPAPQAVGETQIEMCGSQIGYSGEIAILSAAVTATNQNAWIEVIEETLQDPKYADMELVTTVYGDDDPTKSTEEAQGLIQAYPNLKCIIAPTTVGIAAAAQVVTQQNLCDKVIVTGLGLPSEMREFVKAGCVKQNALWNFQDIGYLAAYAAHNVLTGDTGEAGETFEAGRLGEITVEEDGIVYAPELLVFTPENIDDYDF